jgi:uncharacterized protein YjiS (DUF1127 family)
MNTRSFDTSFLASPPTAPIRKHNEKTTVAANQSIAESPCSSAAVSPRTLAASYNTAGSATSARFPDTRRSQRFPIGATIAKLWGHWRDERKIRRAIRELAELDEHTLRDLGIRDRSEIEFTVRLYRQR